MNAERCVCCGEIIPEGRQVCPSCEKNEIRKGNKMADRKNSEGYSDPTAYGAAVRIEREEKELKKKSDNVIGTLKLIADLAGFEFIGRIQIRHKASGKEFR